MDKNDPHASTQSPTAGSSTAQSQRDLSLEEIIQLANKIGLEYADKRRDAERLELLRTTVRARIMNRIESESGSEASIPEGRLKRLAEADSEYVELLEQIALTRAESEKLRIRYESYRNLFDAKRTMISYKKTELKTL